jgi:DNA adenine methylase
MALFRYCGGKVALVKHIAPHIKLRSDSVYVEPFAGGASVALEIARKHRDIQIILNDLDPGVAAFWSIVAGDDDQQFSLLVQRVISCEPTLEQYFEYKKIVPTTQLDHAFLFLYFNRTSSAPSNGKRPLGGRTQKNPGEIASRWNQQRLWAELVEARELLRGRTKVYNLDFEEITRMAQPNWVFYFDPPYYRAGNLLYNFKWSDADHVRLRNIALATPADWVLSYDAHPRILELYGGWTRTVVIPARYSMSKRKDTELILLPQRVKGAAVSLAMPKEDEPEPVITHSQRYGAGASWEIPKNFAEFYERYPSFVRHWTTRKMHLSRRKIKPCEQHVFEATVEDYTQEMLKFLMALPPKSKYRAMGFTDPIQLFNPTLWGTVSSQKFFAWLKQLLSNKFATLRTQEFRDALPRAKDHLGMVKDQWNLDQRHLDYVMMRDFVATERPSLLPIFDAVGDRDIRQHTGLEEFDKAKSRLVRLLRERFINGRTVQKRKDYVRKKTRAARA